MAKESTYSTATPTGTDYVRLIDDPGGTPVTANATVASLSDAMTGAVVYRIWDGMSEAINTVWQSFWAETAKAVLIIEPKASGVYTLDNTAVSCTGSAATAEKYVFGNNQEVFTNTGSLLWRGAVGASNNRVLFLDKFFFSAYSGNADSTGAGLVFQNTNWNYLDVRCKSTKVLVGTHTATGQAEFNWMRFDLQNCDSESPLQFKALSSGDGSMRGNQIHARIFGSGIENAFRCSMNLYHSEVEIHAGGIGGTGGSPSTDPTTAGYTGANAVFWWENDGATDNSIHGARIKLRTEKGSGTGKVGLWFEDNGSARKQEHGHIDFATIYAQDYMAVADFAHPSELPRFTFGINQQTQVNAWTADDGSWIVPVMRWDGGRYNITDVPGVYGDGVTDVDALIGTALSNGGSWYFPPGNYHLSATVAITHTDHLDVDCADGVLFSTNGETIDGSGSVDLFEFDTSNTGNTDGPLRFRWFGGIVDMSGLTNAAGNNLNQRNFGYLNQGTADTTDGFSFRNGYWSDLHLEGIHFFTKTNSWEEYPSDPARQHWMGDYTNGYISGGDSAIYVNCGPGSVTVRDCTFAGTRDSAVYIAATGNAGGGGVGTTAPALVHIDGCKFYWCSEAVSLKGAGTTPAIVSNCLAYGCMFGFLTDHQASSSRAGWDHVQFVNCVADIYQYAFQTIESDGCEFVNCRALNGGYVDWGNSIRGSYGVVTLTGGASGSVDSITITGVNGGSNILSGSVNFTSTLAATAAAVAANINAGTGTHGVTANSVDAAVNIHTTADAAEINGNTVTSSATTITTSDTNMAYMFGDCYALEVEGSAGTVVDGLRVDGVHASWSAQRDSRSVRGFLIQGLAAAASSTGGNIDATDTVVRHTYIDGVQATGGDVNVSGPGDPLRTRFIGITVGPAGVTTEAPTVLDVSSFVDWQEVRMAHRAEGSTQAIDTTTMEDIVGLSVGVVAGASYLLDGYIIYDANSADDMRFTWSITGTETDSYSTIMGPGNTATGNTGIVNYLANATSTQTQVGGIDQVDANDIIGAPITGVVTAVSTGSCTLQARLGVDSSASDGRIYDGSWFRLTRVG